MIIYSVNSFILQQHLPNAQLILYPDANHGSQYQYPELFVRHVSMFLSEYGASVYSVSESLPLARWQRSAEEHVLDGLETVPKTL